MPRSPGPRKYDPLVAYLASLTADEVRLTLVEIEAIIGAALPPSARKPPFWGNASEQVVELPWLRAGWRVRRTDLRNDPPAVTFVRARPDSTE